VVSDPCCPACPGEPEIVEHVMLFCDCLSEERQRLRSILDFHRIDRQYHYCWAVLLLSSRFLVHLPTFKWLELMWWIGSRIVHISPV